jgi:hypothetical protein
MKLLLIITTAGLATFFILKHRRPELADRVEAAVKDAAEHVREDAPGEIAEKLRDKAKAVVS